MSVFLKVFNYETFWRNDALDYTTWRDQGYATVASFQMANTQSSDPIGYQIQPPHWTHASCKSADKVSDGTVGHPLNPSNNGVELISKDKSSSFFYKISPFLIKRFHTKPLLQGEEQAADTTWPRTVPAVKGVKSSLLVFRRTPLHKKTSGKGLLQRVGEWLPGVGPFLALMEIRFQIPANVVC